MYIQLLVVAIELPGAGAVQVYLWQVHEPGRLPPCGQLSAGACFGSSSSNSGEGICGSK